MLHQTPLGQKSAYIQTYTPTLLFPITRKSTKDFFGFDLWHGYELSWLNLQGKPMMAVAEFIFPCHSPYLIESKSFKLYLNSFNQTSVESIEKLAELLQKDLSNASGDKVIVKLKNLNEINSESFQILSGTCLDEQDIACDTYYVNPDYLTCDHDMVNQTVYSHLLKSNCPVTNQPDWASIVIDYKGQQINHAGLLRYIVSFRDHQDFHEQCVERIFSDIWQRCAPEKLTVAAYYTRRGGLDINPVRSSHEIPIYSIRLWRQ
jgi:7-cyano-7-deazaguanine reductase